MIVGLEFIFEKFFYDPHTYIHQQTNQTTNLLKEMSSSSSSEVVKSSLQSEQEIMCPDCNEELIQNPSDNRCSLCQMCMDEISYEVDDLHQEQQDRWEEEQTYIYGLYESDN